jgi:hypothetical protein
VIHLYTRLRQHLQAQPDAVTLHVQLHAQGAGICLWLLLRLFGRARLRLGHSGCCAPSLLLLRLPRRLLTRLRLLLLVPLAARQLRHGHRSHRERLCVCGLALAAAAALWLQQQPLALGLHVAGRSSAAVRQRTASSSPPAAIGSAPAGMPAPPVTAQLLLAVLAVSGLLRAVHGARRTALALLPAKATNLLRCGAVQASVPAAATAAAPYLLARRPAARGSAATTAQLLLQLRLVGRVLLQGPAAVPLQAAVDDGRCHRSRLLQLGCLCSRRAAMRGAAQLPVLLLLVLRLLLHVSLGLL